MTGLSETEDVVEGLEAGGVDYVTKPIVPDELLARIRVHLANARAAHGRTHRARHARPRPARREPRRRHAVVHAASRKAARRARSVRSTASEFKLPREVRDWLRRAEAGPLPRPDRASPPRLSCSLAYVAQIGPDEILLRLVESDLGDEQACCAPSSR